MMTTNSFKDDFLFKDRLNEANKILHDYPTYVPVICERSIYAGIDCPFIDKKKYLVPPLITLGQFLIVIRKRLKLDSDKALFIIINNHIPSSSKSMSDLYRFYKNDDRFLYITYSFEHVFG